MVQLSKHFGDIHWTRHLGEQIGQLQSIFQQWWWDMLWNICPKIFIKIILLGPRKNQVSLSAKYFGSLSHLRHICHWFRSTSGQFSVNFRSIYGSFWSLSVEYIISITYLSQYYINFYFIFIRWFKEDSIFNSFSFS